MFYTFNMYLCVTYNICSCKSNKRIAIIYYYGYDTALQAKCTVTETGPGTTAVYAVYVRNLTVFIVR